MPTFGDATLEAVVTPHAGEVVVAVSGEVDISSADHFQSVIDFGLSDCLPLVIDLRDTAFIDSSGLAVLILTHRKTEEAGIPLTIRTSPGLVRKVIALGGLTRRLNVDPQDNSQPSPDAVTAAEPSVTGTAP